MEYYSAIKRNTCESILMRWMRQEPIIQSEVSHKAKHQYGILRHIYMEFRKTVTMTLYARQQKRYRCKEQTFGLCGRRWGLEDLGEQHWTMYFAICEIDDQCKFDALSRALKVSALVQSRGVGWGGRWEGGSGRGTHAHLRLIHVDVWQNPPQYCKVISLQLK